MKAPSMQNQMINALLNVYVLPQMKALSTIGSVRTRTTPRTLHCAKASP